MTDLVVHLDELAKVPLAQNNVRHLVSDLPSLHVVLVVNGPAVASLATPAWTAFLTDLPQVQVEACHHALDSQHLTPAQLPAGVHVVAAGVVRIVELQAQGFLYLKP